MREEIGFTTTIPIEVILATGKRPIDLNNLFISHENPLGLIQKAETMGFPRNTCAWIKGIFGITLEKGIRRVIGVTQGDCSYSKVLLEIFASRGMEVIPFAYPPSREPELLRREIERLGCYFSASPEEIQAMFQRLNRIRKKLLYLDELTWKENLVSGHHNHLFLVRASDMGGDPAEFEEEIDLFLQNLPRSSPYPEGEIRLGYIGVPPIFTDLHQFVETLGARIVYNEIQRQFVLPQAQDDLLKGYLYYTYPYDLWGRLADIRYEAERRGLHGLIHYVQCFCHRQLEDIIFQKYLGLPIITIEGDRATSLDTGTKTRLEAFVELLRG